MKLAKPFPALLALVLCVQPLPAQNTATGSVRIDELASVLKSGAGRKEKADACRELAVIGTPESIAPLAALLADPEMSHMARYALEPMPGTEVDQALRDALKTLSGRQLSGVVNSLGVRRDPKAVKPLSELLTHADADVAQAAARALGDIGNAGAAKALENALPGAGKNALAVYEGLLRAAERLSADGKKGRARTLYASLQESQAPHQVRAAGLRGLILSGGQGAQVLKKALQSEDYTQFATAARTAQEMKSPGSVKVLVAELPKLSADRQVVVLQTLALRADASALAAVAAAAESQDKTVRLAAIKALPQFESPKAAPALLPLLADSDKEIARAAQEALSGLAGKEVDSAILSLLESENEQRRLTAMEIITQRRMASALPELTKLMMHNDAATRRAAVRSVGELGGTPQIPSLLSVLEQPKAAEDIDAAASALEVVGVKPGNRDGVVTALKPRLANSQTAQKVALLRVLTTLGGAESLGAVRAALKDSTPGVRAAAVRALTDWSTPEAANDLLDIAQNSSVATEKTLGLRGYLALAGRGDLPESQRIEMCRKATPLISRPEEKRLLLSALGSINSPEAIQLLDAHLTDPAVKNEAATATVALVDKLLKRDNANQLAAGLIKPLQNVVDNSGNEKLVEQARKLLDSAKAKAQ